MRFISPVTNINHRSHPTRSDLPLASPLRNKSHAKSMVLTFALGIETSYRSSIIPHQESTTPNFSPIKTPETQIQGTKDSLRNLYTSLESINISLLRQTDDDRSRCWIGRSLMLHQSICNTLKGALSSWEFPASNMLISLGLKLMSSCCNMGLFAAACSI